MKWLSVLKQRRKEEKQDRILEAVDAYVSKEETRKQGKAWHFQMALLGGLLYLTAPHYFALSQERQSYAEPTFLTFQASMQTAWQPQIDKLLAARRALPQPGQEKFQDTQINLILNELRENEAFVSLSLGYLAVTSYFVTIARDFDNQKRIGVISSEEHESIDGAIKDYRADLQKMKDCLARAKSEKEKLESGLKDPSKSIDTRIQLQKNTVARYKGQDMTSQCARYPDDMLLKAGQLVQRHDASVGAFNKKAQTEMAIQSLVLSIAGAILFFFGDGARLFIWQLGKKLFKKT